MISDFSVDSDGRVLFSLYSFQPRELNDVVHGVRAKRSASRLEGRGVDVEQVAKRGQQLYDSKLKQLLEPASNGRFVAIEPASGSYFIGNTIVEALENAELKLPNADFHVVRIGFVAGASFRHKVTV